MPDHQARQPFGIIKTLLLFSFYVGQLTNPRSIPQFCRLRTDLYILVFGITLDGMKSHKELQMHNLFKEPMFNYGIIQPV